MSWTLGPIGQNLHTGKVKKEEARQIAGYDESGIKASDTIKLADETSGGKLTGVLVTGITPGGAMEKFYGLKRNDSIVEISMGGGALTPVKEFSSASEAKDALVTAFQNSQPIVIVRDEKRLTLPMAVAKSAPAAPAGAPAAAKAPANSGDKDALQRQIDAIPGVR